MSDLELATLLGFHGHQVHKEGFNIESLIEDGVDTRPINYDKFDVIAKQEGYVLTKHGWVESSLTKRD